ncbi:MAG: transaldolase, partial [Gammaproteobacteria bacterium]|nr:transaldolase [Gammaproteobacteria bacterium]
IWLDYIDRGLLDEGGLQRLIDEDGLAGVTSNPSIFKKAITTTGLYDDEISSQADHGADAEDIYLELAVDDIRRAADVLRPVYDATDGADGFVSLEVSPHLAHDTETSVDQARVLWKRVDRPNLMIKIPGTLAGLPAIEQLIADGINVNVTLLFSVDRYREVADAYMNGLEARARRSLPVDGIASVASFFLSRIDSKVDDRLSDHPELQGKTAVACARTAYSLFGELSASPRWQKLAEFGASPQRLLWASTSTKNPEYSDVLYVDSLIGPQTVNTLPPKTLEAYRDHGEPAQTIDNDLDAVAEQLRGVASAGIDLGKIADELEAEGVQSFIEAYDQLLDALDSERSRLRTA